MGLLGGIRKETMSTEDNYLGTAVPFTDRLNLKIIRQIAQSDPNRPEYVSKPYNVAKQLKSDPNGKPTMRTIKRCPECDHRRIIEQQPTCPNGCASSNGDEQLKEGTK